MRKKIANVNKMITAAFVCLTLITAFSIALASMPTSMVTPIVSPAHSTTEQSVESKIDFTSSNYTELLYDDNNANSGWATGPVGGAAVLFTPPSRPWVLSKVKVMAWYTLDDAPFYIEIWDNKRSELFRGTYMYSDYFSSATKWAEIDIPDISVTGDFYVCVFPNDKGDEGHILWLGFDSNPPISNRSYAVDYPDNSIGYVEDWNWMIRAISVSCPDADGDGVCDADDNCPNVPGPAWNCGCPCPGDADVVFIMDTSGSMDDEFSTLCSEIPTIISSLQSPGITVTYKIVGITENRDCTSDYVTNMVTNPISDHEEDWGPATQDIAGKYSWRAGATRIIIPMSDEGPDDGCPITSDDHTSITNAIASAKANNVRVSPVTCSESGQCTAADYNTMVSLAQQLASATNGTLFKSTDPASDLVNGLIAQIGIGSCDRDGDGVPDGCDPKPDNPCICGDWDGDRVDDCAWRCQGNCTLIHLDGKNCVNQPFVARLTTEDETPIQGTITFSLGGSQYPKMTDAQGYTTFTPQTTGTLTATYFDASGKRWEVTCEIIDDPTLCDDGDCNFCQDPTQGTVSITSFTTDKSSYTCGQTIKVTMVANNAENCIYKKLLTDVSATKSDTGVPLGFSGSWSMFDTGTNTYEMRLYIPTAIAPGSYQVTGGIYTDYIAQGGTIKSIATPVTVTVS